MKKKKQSTRRRPMYAFGTSIESALDNMNGVVKPTPPNVIQTPDEAITENQLAYDRAQIKASKNGWTQGLDIFGNLAMQMGSSMMSQGMGMGQGVSKGGFNYGNLMKMGVDSLGVATKFATGGEVNDPLDMKQDDITNNARNFVGSWFSNPETRKRLAENLGITQEEADAMINSGIGNLAVTDVKGYPDNTSPHKGSYNFYGPTIDLYGDPSERVAVHEFTHAMADPKAGRTGQGIDRKLSNKILQDIGPATVPETSHPAFKDQARYINSNGELYPRIMEMRHSLGVNPGDVIDDVQIEQLQNTDKVNELFKYYKPEDIKLMLNTLASNQDIGGTDFAAFGGMTGNNVEVEGQEVGQLPDGQMLDFQGPSHEQGGIDVSLPDNTMIYSKRIKVDGLSMADRKKRREKKALSLQDLLDMNSTDALLKNSLQKTIDNNAIEEQYDTMVQDQVTQLLQSQEADKFLTGGKTGQKKAQVVDTAPIVTGKSTPEMFTTTLPGKQAVIDPNAGGVNWKDIFNKMNNPVDGMTFGDGVGFMGDIISTFGAEDLVNKNRAGDQPNVNPYVNFGKEGLKTLEGSKGSVNAIRDQMLNDLALSSASATKQNRGTARGVNTMRALDLATANAANNQRSNIYSKALEQMLGIDSAIAGQQNQMDQVVMGGEGARELADRQDRDNYFTQLSDAVMSKGKGLQTIGKNLNKIKGNKETTKMIEELKALGMEDNDIKLFLQNLYKTPGITPPTETKKKG